MRNLLGGRMGSTAFPDHNPIRNDITWGTKWVWCSHCHVHRAIEDHEGAEDA